MSDTTFFQSQGLLTEQGDKEHFANHFFFPELWVLELICFHRVVVRIGINTCTK